ncbi:Gfo/Idh/MocA family oxidoreductase [Alloacidobacterium sp.]|uniref:Gfo/Idh/MocA family protein n=1 Tax=Alloacidobacterium sp. TaxID=2951999 RepID=UPI002D43500E|nr:Gfo/Idh/MocA family oxidoreductase [Alloacidobacterium sp.]HYK37495.1 Gfo/Idh/MocA family oxidoreductase [Alloacidobacterium sp.]
MNRRKFLAGSAAASGLMLLKPKTAFGYEANSAVRYALLGCGSRGTAVATSFAKNTSARIVAIADLFQDQLDKGKTYFDSLNQSLGYAGPEHQFRGYEAYEELAASPDVDAVQISTPPWFHVQHLEAVAHGGKHAYCEKPVGVDITQTNQALEIAKRVDGKLSVDVGFQIRSAPPFVEIVRRIHEGELGKIASIAAHYNSPPAVEHDYPNASADEQRIRNWLWYRNLSGDILLEQNIHVIDICNWALQTHPVKAVATGGRSVITHAGDTWDNYQVIFTYPEDIRVSFSSTQFCPGKWFDVSERIFGSKGIAEMPYSGPLRILGANPWTWADSVTQQPSGSFAANGAFSDNLAQADSEKDKGFIESITSGKFHNQIAAGVESARSCMLGRMAGYQKREVIWDELIASHEEYKLGINMSQFS